MRIRATRLIVCLAAAGLLTGCASAGSSGPKLSDIDKNFLQGIGSYDQNHDGVVTCDEWRAAAANLFTAANKSHSGALTEEEFLSLGASDRTFIQAGFKYYDVNGDGKIDRKEFVERPNPAFAYADKDKDCRLTDAEQIEARNISAPPAPSTSKHDVATTGGSPGGPQTAGPVGGRY